MVLYADYDSPLECSGGGHMLRRDHTVLPAIDMWCNEPSSHCFAAAEPYHSSWHSFPISCLILALHKSFACLLNFPTLLTSFFLTLLLP